MPQIERICRDTQREKCKSISSDTLVKIASVKLNSINCELKQPRAWNCRRSLQRFYPKPIVFIPLSGRIITIHRQYYCTRWLIQRQPNRHERVHYEAALMVTARLVVYPYSRSFVMLYPSRSRSLPTYFVLSLVRLSPFIAHWTSKPRVQC